MIDLLDGKGIFGTDIDVTLMGSEGITGNGHSFDYLMRRALKNDPVHEGARIAFISIADDIFGMPLCLETFLPFPSCRKAGAPQSPQPRSLHFVDDLFLCHGQGFVQRFIAAQADIIPDLSRGDYSCIPKDDSFL